MANSSAIQLADLALVWSNASGDADLSMIDSDLASDRGLETAVVLSLFTDRRADDDDVPPSGDARDRRGWWADQFATVESDKIGSRLWLLDRSTLSRETQLRATEYVREALQWMLDDGVAENVNVAVTTPTGAIAKTSGAQLMIAVDLQRPGRDAVSLRFAARWDHLQEDV